MVARGALPARPFVIACQQYVADPWRGLAQWTYAHVPRGYRERCPGEVTKLIEAQITRFAPGFPSVIRRRIAHNAAALEAWNPKLNGGDIAGGNMRGAQML